MMRLVLILAIAVAVDAFFLRVHHASTKTIRRRAPMLYVAATLAPANNTDSAVSGDALTRPTSYQKLHIQGQSSKDGRKNAATRKWNVRFKELEKFHRRFGHFEANEPKALANWVRNQRMQYRYMHQGGKESLCFLTTERIQKLEGIGFVWNPQESKWNRMYAQLVDYRNHYGDCNVPSRWEENAKLSQWVSSQRFKYKARQRGRQIGEAIKEEQIELLNSLDFSWNPKGDTWWTMYDALKEYKLKHDTCAVPQSHPTLGAWVRHQRRACRELVLWHTIDKAKEEVFVSGIDKDRLQALRAIDFCWLPDQNDPQDPPTDIFDYKK
jgi:hypothetical protein